MGETTGIQWTDHTFNPWIGCTKVSPACDNCYAEKGSMRLGAQHGLKLWGGDRFFTGASYWKQPAKWNRAAIADGVRRRVFCASFADVFEDRPDLADKRAQLLTLILSTPQLDWLLLTKRPELAARLWADSARTAGLSSGWLPNIWLGTTAEDQAHADERIPHLLDVPAAVRFVSYEPALGPVNLRRFAMSSPRPGACRCGHGHGFTRCPNTGGVAQTCHACDCRAFARAAGEGLHWVIVGGESGAGARPFDIDWARSTVGQCRAAGVAVFVKQLGAEPREYAEIAGAMSHVRLKHKKGAEMDEWPTDLRVREFPKAVP